MGDFYDPDTIGDHKTSECVSALQKCIRRGMRDDALHWAVELHLSGHATRLWNRLTIIASEDIGPAVPSLPATIAALRASFEAMAKKKHPQGPERLFLVHAVILMADAPKCRIVDNALMVHYECHGHRPIPDVALDKHTQKGRSMGRGFEHFFDEGAKLENVAPVDDPYAAKARDIMVTRKPSLDESKHQAHLFDDGDV